jgi:GNAT superfamily N-acetyltransferase
MGQGPVTHLSVELKTFLAAWLGGWPDPPERLVAVGAPVRDEPGWDGVVQPVLGVTDAAGRGVLSVAPRFAGAVGDLLAQGGDVSASLPAIVGRPRSTYFSGVLRWTVAPAPLPEAGRWEPAASATVPAWLHPFGAEVLIARDPDGAYLAGVGLKRHHPTGVEIAVGTEPAARGRGLARRLVAQAARRIVAGGAVATYLHDPANVASAHVAAAAGFPDLGWHVHGLTRDDA